MTRRGAEIVLLCLVAAGLIGLVWVIAAWSADPPMDTVTICKTVAVVTVWSNTAEDSTLRIVRADTTVTWDTLPGVKCPGGKP